MERFLTIVRSKTSTFRLFEITLLLEKWKLVCIISTFRVPGRSKSGWRKQDSVSKGCRVLASAIETLNSLCLYYIGETFFSYFTIYFFVIECQIPVVGRPKVMLKRGERVLSKIVKCNKRSSLKDLTKEYNQSTPCKVSTRTVQRKLHFLGYTRRSVRKTISIKAVNKTRRLAWCRGKIHWTIDNWEKVMFTDEMMIVICPDGKTKIWRKASEKWRPECLGYVAHGPKSTLKIMVWGCITYQGIGTLAFIDGNMNSEKYIKTLDDSIWQVVAKNYGVNTCLFQDDNAPCHRSRLSEEWKHRYQIPQLSWPAQSPDLSPIENVWQLLKNTIKNRLYLIHNVNDLKEQLLRAWNEVPLFYIQKLYAILPRRCRQVIIQRGDITKF